MQKIVPHLWYDKRAGEAARLYTSVFERSSITSETKIGDTPSGDVEILTIELSGQKFMLMSAGPEFKFTPAISFLVTRGTKEAVDRLWGELHASGKELMALSEYPFSERYGWTEDRFGLSWQVMYAKEKPDRPIVPAMMFVGDNCGKAEEALRFYASVFRDSSIGEISRYGRGAEPNAENMVMHASFRLEGQDFAAMDSAYDHGFTFNEAVSLMVYCDSQEEIDHYWNSLSAVPEAEQCGWLKDKYGVSWQIVPGIMDAMMREGDPARRARVTDAFMKMKKFDIAELERAAR